MDYTVDFGRKQGTTKPINRQHSHGVKALSEDKAPWGEEEEFDTTKVIKFT